MERTPEKIEWTPEKIERFCNKLYGGSGPRERSLFAALIGVSESTVDLWLRKPNNLASTTLDRLANENEFKG